VITGISFVSVPVDDIDEALRFYCDVLGMEKRVDAATAEGNRFVEVAPPQSAVGLAPYTYYGQEPRATIGEYSRVVLTVDDVRRSYEELTAKGVRARSRAPRGRPASRVPYARRSSWRCARGE
jgi:catechol 2,3-dioxygenase-like lactoylglutathione lyase family enzyme